MRWTTLLQRCCRTAAGLSAMIWMTSTADFYRTARAQPQAAKTVKPKKTIKEAKKGAAPAKKGAKRTTKPAPTNPLGRLIRQLLPRKLPARILPAKPAVKKPVTPKIPNAANGDSLARDYIDARAPYDPEASKLLENAISYMKTGHWEPAAKLLQRLMDRGEDSLVRTPAGKWVSLRFEANRLLGGFPEKYRRAYRLEYGKPAEQMLAAALPRGDLAQIVTIASRYFHTTAGKQAADHLASWYLDRGEYDMASRWYVRLLNSRATFHSDPQWMIKVVYALRAAGEFERSEQLLKAIETIVGNQGLMIGGRRQNPRAWINASHLDHWSKPRVLSEWPVFLGSPSRTGTVVGGDPLLLSRWSHPTTYSHIVRQKIERVTINLADQGRAMIPAAFPLMIDGKIIFRTMRGVQVVDAGTGRALWETREGVSAERILGKTPPRPHFPSSRFGGMRVIRSYGVPGNDGERLKRLLFCNGTYGNISSDGKRLFVLEDHALLSRQIPGNRYSRNPESSDLYRRSWTTNKLAAYDLTTGRPVWEIGGRERHESLDLPLAGTYFFSIPVAQNGVLYIVGEKRNEIRVFALDAATGLPKWSQLIAYSDSKINRDFGRRWFSAQVSVSDGMLICPTTVGWLVAVDRLNHSVLWAYRYQKHLSQPVLSPNSTLVQSATLNTRWTPSAPVISRGYVVYTPSEDASVVCLRLLDGETVWKIPKGASLYLAGVFGDRVVLVGKSDVTAISLRQGSTLWTVPIPLSAGLPSGMGVAVGSSYHLPLSSGQLWTIDMRRGKVTAKQFLSGQTRRLGNLSMYRGMLLSLDPLAITGFELHDSIEAKIRQRKTVSPTDSWALMREVEIVLLSRDYESALKSLRKIRPDRLSAEMRPSYRKAFVRSLSAVIRSDFQSHRKEVEELATFVRGPSELFLYRRLAAERYDSRNDMVKAFDIYTDLSKDPLARQVSRADNPNLKVALQQWIAGRLRDLYRRADPPTRLQFDRRIAVAASAVTRGNLSAERKFCRLYGFHPQATAQRIRLAQSYRNAGEFARSEQLLLSLSRDGNPQTAAAALLELGRSLQAAGHSRDAAHAYRILREKYARTKLAGGKTVAAILAEFRARKVPVAATEPPPVSWAGRKMKVERYGTGNNSDSMNQELFVPSNKWPFFQEHRLVVSHSRQQLQVVKSRREIVEWLAPLRGRAGVSSSKFVAVQSTGHTLFLVNWHTVHCLSLIEKKVLWTLPLEVFRNPSGFLSSDSSAKSATRKLFPRMQFYSGKGTSSSPDWGFWRNPAFPPYMPIANGERLGVYGRRKFLMLDAMTGETVWQLTELPSGTAVVGSRDIVYVMPQNRENSYAVRALDGKRLPLKNVNAVLNRTIAVSGNKLLLLDAPRNSLMKFLSRSKTIRLFDPLTGREQWRKSYPTDTLFSILLDGTLVALRSDGVLETIDVETGSTQWKAAIPAANARSKSAVHAIADGDTLFLFVNSPRNKFIDYSGNLPTIPVDGTVFAFDRKSGRRLWKRPVTKQNLILQQVTHSPVLTFTQRENHQLNRISYSSINLLVIDKRSGEQLLEQSMPTTQLYNLLSINLVDRAVEIRSSMQKIRLIAAEKDHGEKPTRPQSRTSSKPVAKRSSKPSP